MCTILLFFRITMQEALSEVDVSMINRLSSYIYSPDFRDSKKNSLNVCFVFFLLFIYCRVGSRAFRFVKPYR